MSKQQRYTEEFKLAAVKQVTKRHHPVAEVASDSVFPATVFTSGSNATASPKCSNSMTPASKPRSGASRLSCAASPMSEIS